MCIYKHKHIHTLVDYLIIFHAYRASFKPGESIFSLGRPYTLETMFIVLTSIFASPSAVDAAERGKDVILYIEDLPTF